MIPLKKKNHIDQRKSSSCHVELRTDPIADVTANHPLLRHFKISFLRYKLTFFFLSREKTDTIRKPTKKKILEGFLKYYEKIQSCEAACGSSRRFADCFLAYPIRVGASGGPSTARSEKRRIQLRKIKSGHGGDRCNPNRCSLLHGLLLHLLPPLLRRTRPRRFASWRS